MNFLAHIYLSGDSKEIMIGNFIADAIRGSDFEGFSPGVIKGIQLHRKIDHFTDTHPIFYSTKTRLRNEYGKYSGVIADIFYDHFLAIDWHHYHILPLPEYAETIYNLMQSNVHEMPEKVQEFLPYMIRGNWLVNYARIEGIKRTLEGMSRRAKFESGMHSAVNELIRNYELYRNEFREFFPEIQKYVKTQLSA